MALEWEKEDERSVGLMFEIAYLKTDPNEKDQVRKGQAILEVMDKILEALLALPRDEEESADD